MLLKQESRNKSPSLLRNLALVTFGELLMVFLAKVNLLYIPLLINGPKVLSSASDKANFLLKTFLITLTLMTGVSFYLFYLLELI